mmetsp:Transcript_103836/g.268786  ORF Transcript_103836/g.268786 Transcript_103836/m.268786 type:complete len:318 (-) Transcript_103836:624-1577(-)
MARSSGRSTVMQAHDGERSLEYLLRDEALDSIWKPLLSPSLGKTQPKSLLKVAKSSPFLASIACPLSNFMSTSFNKAESSLSMFSRSFSTIPPTFTRCVSGRSKPPPAPPGLWPPPALHATACAVPPAAVPAVAPHFMVTPIVAKAPACLVSIVTCSSRRFTMRPLRFASSRVEWPNPFKSPSTMSVLGTRSSFGFGGATGPPSGLRPTPRPRPRTSLFMAAPSAAEEQQPSFLQASVLMFSPSLSNLLSLSSIEANNLELYCEAWTVSLNSSKACPHCKARASTFSVTSDTPSFKKVSIVRVSLFLIMCSSLQNSL